MDNPKIFIHKNALEISTSVLEGLPFVCTPYIDLLVKGCLAKAQEKYHLTICHFVVMANHIHLLCVVDDPEVVPNFMREFKVELAHLMNGLLGRSGGFWETGYFSSPILSAETFIERMLYLYLNPVDARCESGIEKYPGAHSFQALLQNEASSEVCRKVSRPGICELPKRNLSLKEQFTFARRLHEAEGSIDVLLEIDPWAWLECYESTRNKSPEQFRATFLSRLKREEDRYRKEREQNKKPVIGALALRLENPRRPFKSKRDGKRMICLCSCSETRKRFILWYTEQRKQLRMAYQRWKSGDYSVPFPPGFFAPGGALRANLLPSAIPI